MGDCVQFVYLTQDEYDNIQQKQNKCLYFTSDTHLIYRGGTLYSEQASKTSQLTNDSDFLTEEEIEDRDSMPIVADQCRQDSKGQDAHSVHALSSTQQEVC